MRHKSPAKQKAAIYLQFVVDVTITLIFLAFDTISFFSSSAKHFFDKFQMLNSELHLFYPQNVELNKWWTLNVAH